MTTTLENIVLDENLENSFSENIEKLNKQQLLSHIIDLSVDNIEKYLNSKPVKTFSTQKVVFDLYELKKELIEKSLNLLAPTIPSLVVNLNDFTEFTELCETLVNSYIDKNYCSVFAFKHKGVRCFIVKSIVDDVTDLFGFRQFDVETVGDEILK